MSKTASFTSRLRRARFLSLFIKRREHEHKLLASPLHLQELRVVFGWTAGKARKIKSCALCCQAAGIRATIIEYYEQIKELAATKGWGTRVVWGMPELTLLSRHCEELRRNLRFQQQLQLQTESGTFKKWSSSSRKRVKAPFLSQIVVAVFYCIISWQCISSAGFDAKAIYQLPRFHDFGQLVRWLSNKLQHETYWALLFA
jgi:hypothetical protein